MQSLCNKIKDVDVPCAVTLLLVSVPSYYVVKNHVVPTIKEKYHHVYTEPIHINKEEDILEAKVKSENIRSGPVFIDSHAYRGRRTERVKEAFNSVCQQVNKNLDSGNRVFKIPVDDDDRIILNVTRRLLLDELSIDGYNATVLVEKTPIFDTVNINNEDEVKEKPKPYNLLVTIS